MANRHLFRVAGRPDLTIGTPERMGSSDPEADQLLSDMLTEVRRSFQNVQIPEDRIRHQEATKFESLRGSNVPLTQSQLKSFAELYPDWTIELALYKGKVSKTYSRNSPEGLSKISNQTVMEHFEQADNIITIYGDELIVVDGFKLIAKENGPIDQGDLYSVAMVEEYIQAQYAGRDNTQ